MGSDAIVWRDESLTVYRACPGNAQLEVCARWSGDGWTCTVAVAGWTCTRALMPDRDSAKRACEELWRKLNGGT